MIFRKFRGHFYDDVIHRDDSYLSLNEEVKIKDQDQRLTLVTLRDLFSVKFSVELGINSDFAISITFSLKGNEGSLICALLFFLIDSMLLPRSSSSST